MPSLDDPSIHIQKIIELRNLKHEEENEKGEEKKKKSPIHREPGT